MRDDLDDNLDPIGDDNDNPDHPDFDPTLNPYLAGDYLDDDNRHPPADDRHPPATGGGLGIRYTSHEGSGATNRPKDKPDEPKDEAHPDSEFFAGFVGANPVTRTGLEVGGRQTTSHQIPADRSRPAVPPTPDTPPAILAGRRRGGKKFIPVHGVAESLSTSSSTSPIDARSIGSEEGRLAGPNPAGRNSTGESPVRSHPTHGPGAGEPREAVRGLPHRETQPEPGIAITEEQLAHATVLLQQQIAEVIKLDSRNSKSSPQSSSSVEVIQPDVAKFRKAIFSAYLKDLRFMSSGDLVINLIVPAGSADAAIPLRKTYGIELECMFRRKATQR